MIYITSHGYKHTTTIFIITILCNYLIESVREYSWRSVFSFSVRRTICNSCLFVFLAIQPPPTRSWLRLASPSTTQPTAIFTIMNYNILCDKYATRHAYGYCPSWALKWDYRRKQILEELRSYSADIIALQV